MISKRKLGAWLNLAWHFARHVVTRLPLRPLRRGRDLARYNAAIAPEGFVPLTGEQRAAFPAFMNCVHCGLCALACRDLRAEPRSAWDEPWTFAGGAAHGMSRGRSPAAHRVRWTAPPWLPHSYPFAPLARRRLPRARPACRFRSWRM